MDAKRVKILSVQNINTYKQQLSFILNNADVSVVNALRRVILSNIQTVVLRGFPDKDNKINIQKNTTRFNNEYLKHRLSCIPVHNVDEMEFENFCNLYQMVIKEENDTLEKKHITTEHIKLINKTTKEEMKEDIEKYFPRDPITNEHILICILYPNFSQSKEENECIDLVASFETGCAKENSCWNVVHHCAYECVQNHTEVEKASNKIENPMKRKDFMLLDAQRIVQPNVFALTLEGIGIYDNTLIVKKACRYILSRLSKIEDYFHPNNKKRSIMKKDELVELMKDGTSDEGQLLENMYCLLFKEDDFYIFELRDDDYTIGKLLENHFFELYESETSFVGFKKDHPTKKEAYIYIKYKSNETNDVLVYTHFSNLITNLITLFKTIDDEFKI